MSTTAFLFTEKVTETFETSVALKKIMVDDKSEFQEIQLIETADFGKTLVLDGKTQSTARDEHVYHECLVHPALLLHPNPKTVYIGGGGELATAREILKHKTVERVVMVDIDQKVVEFCKKHLPEWSDGSHEDPRLEVHYTDAKAFLEEFDGKFDVIVMDIADPIEAGPGYVLYTQEFYQLAVTKLNPGGMVVTQSGPCGLLTYDECFTVIYNTLVSVFDHVLPYHVEIPSFGTPWGFNIAYKSHESLPSAFESSRVTPQHVDELVAQRLKDVQEKPLYFYDGVSHQSICALPKYVRQALKNETRVMTVDNPVFMY